MKISIDYLIGNSFVISIDKDRYFNFCNLMNMQKIKSNDIRLYDGYRIKNGINKECGIIKTNNVINCSLSHLSLVKMAKTLDMPFVCIFEDDAIPCKNLIDKLNYYLSDIPEDTDCIKLGYSAVHGQSTCYNDKFELQNNITYGAQSYIIFNRYYDDYINIWYDDMRSDISVLNSNSHKILSTKELLFIPNVFDDKLTLHNNKFGIQSILAILSKQQLLENFNINI